MQANYKKISFFIIIAVAIILIGVAGAHYLKYGLASLLNQPIQNQSSASFAVLAGSTITNTGSSVITGDIGLSPGTSVTGFPPGLVSGTKHITDGVAAQGQTDLTISYNDAAGRTPTITYSPVHDLGGSTLTPGVYNDPSSFGITGTLTLDAGGNPNAVWIFQAGTTLTTASSSVVSLINGAQPCNVFWQVGSSATLGTSSTFVGNIFASDSVTLNTGASVSGRVLAQTGAVTLDTNTIVLSTCSNSNIGTLHVIKHVSGGNSVAANFTMHVAGTNVSSGSFAGSETGVDVTLDAGSYSVTETGPLNYTESDSGDCSGTMAIGGDKTCIITNTSTPVPTATLHVIKTVVAGPKTGPLEFPPLFIDGAQVDSGAANIVTPGAHVVTEKADGNYTQTFSDNCAGGNITVVANDDVTCTITNTYNVPAIPPSSSSVGGRAIAPIIDVVKLPSPLSLPAGPGLVTYTYTLGNIGIFPMSNVTMVDDSCNPIVFVSGDANNDAKLDTTEKWTYTCSTRLLATHTNTVVATGWANGVSATDITSATVVVGASIVPPLVHVTKVPNPLFLSAGGGMATYTNKVTNPGTVALSNIQIVDDKCSSIRYVSGDTNGDSKLDVNETWTYICKTNLIKTTTNTVTVSGQANGLTARDFAIATVVVAAPKFPNTGSAPIFK